MKDDFLSAHASVEQLTRAIDNLVWLKAKLKNEMTNNPEGFNTPEYIDKRIEKLSKILADKEVLGELAKE